MNLKRVNKQQFIHLHTLTIDDISIQLLKVHLNYTTDVFKKNSYQPFTR